MDDDTTPTKVCTKCGKELLATPEFFYPKKSCRYGLNSYCRKCASRISVEYNRRKPEQAEARRKRWRERNPEKDRKSKRAYYERNRDSILAKTKRRYLENADAIKKYVNKWRRNNPDKRRASHLKRKAQKRGGAGNVSAKELAQLFDMQQGRCWYCQCDISDDYHIDHRIPLSRGGKHVISNLVLACPNCNLSKHAKTPDEWIGRLL